MSSSLLSPPPYYNRAATAEPTAILRIFGKVPAAGRVVLPAPVSPRGVTGALLLASTAAAKVTVLVVTVVTAPVSDIKSSTVCPWYESSSGKNRCGDREPRASGARTLGQHHQHQAQQRPPLLFIGQGARGLDAEPAVQHRGLAHQPQDQGAILAGHAIGGPKEVAVQQPDEGDLVHQGGDDLQPGVELGDGHDLQVAIQDLVACAPEGGDAFTLDGPQGAALGVGEGVRRRDPQHGRGLDAIQGGRLLLIGVEGDLFFEREEFLLDVDDQLPVGIGHRQLWGQPVLKRQRQWILEHSNPPVLVNRWRLQTPRGAGNVESRRYF